MKDNKNLKIGLGFLIVILIAFLAFTLGSADAGISDTKDVKEVQAVIRKSYDLEIKASRNFDLSEFSSVFINDPRIPLDKSTKDFIKKVKVKNNKPIKENYGFLDYKKTYYELWQASAIESEALQEKARKENRELTVDEKRILAENMHRATGPEKAVRIVFHSIKVEGDMATAIFDDGPRLNEFHLVKIDDKWFIAGWKILEVHA